MTGGRYAVIALSALVPSEWNTRTSMDDAELAALEADVKERGVRVPLSVRPHPTKEGQFEIAAGHRRYRVAMRLELAGVPCQIFNMTDEEFLVELGIDNGQREDIHPLDEAAYLERLRVTLNGDLKAVAARLKRPFLHVYNRHRLLNLIGPFAAAFRAQALTLGHVIVLARLSTEQQQIVLDSHEALLSNDATHASLFDGDDESDEVEERPFWFGNKARSVGELQTWIDRNIRFELENEETALVLFPETYAAVEAIAQKARKRGIIAISELHQVPPSAKDPKRRTYSVVSWRRADGKHKSETCEYSKLGIVVAGPGRGQSFAACVDREHCATHFGDAIKARKQRQKEIAKAEKAGGAPATREALGTQQEQWRVEEAKREHRSNQWAVAIPRIAEAISQGLTKVTKIVAGAQLTAHLWEVFRMLEQDDRQQCALWRSHYLLAPFVLDGEELAALEDARESEDGDESAVITKIIHDVREEWLKVIAGGNPHELHDGEAEPVGDALLRTMITASVFERLSPWKLGQGHLNALASSMGVDLNAMREAVTDDEIKALADADAAQELAAQEAEEGAEELWDEEEGDVEAEAGSSEQEEGSDDDEQE